MKTIELTVNILPSGTMLYHVDCLGRACRSRIDHVSIHAIEQGTGDIVIKVHYFISNVSESIAEIEQHEIGSTYFTTKGELVNYMINQLTDL